MSKGFKKKTCMEGYISADPLPSLEELQKHYSEKYYQSPGTSSYQLQYPQIEYDYKKLKYDAILEAVKQNGVNRGEFLDIGAGEGFFLKSAKDFGYNVTGIDFSSFGVEKFNPSLASNLISGDIYQMIQTLIDANKKFDLCSSVNVLEHVIDPDLFLNKIKSVMKPNAVLSITVPNDYSSLQDLLLQEKMIDREFWFAPPDHLHYFNTENLIPYVESQGFKVVDSFSDFPIDTFLLHPGSNYVMNKQAGPSAHQARMIFDLLISKKGMDKYLNYYRAMYQVGIGRDITLLMRVDSIK